MNNKFKRIVIWGLKYRYHTQRHIYKAYYENAKKLGYKTIWLEDEKKSQKYILPGDLIMSQGQIGKMSPEKFTFEDYNMPVRDDIYYCMHNIKNVFLEKLNKNNYINLQVYNNIVLTIEGIEKWGSARYFDRKTKTLYQPWGTDLLIEEFKEPVFNENSIVFWVGNIWNDKLKQGNSNEIPILIKALHKYHLNFIPIKVVPDFLHIFLVRHSRIAPAIVGRYQEEVNYLPCRMFKNISYGQLGITNVKKFKDILGDSFIEGDTIEKLIDNALSLTKQEYLEKTKKQQELIKDYTYKSAIENIFKAFN